MYKKLIDIKRKSDAVRSIISMIVFGLKNGDSFSDIIDYQLAKLMGILELNFELNNNRFFTPDEVNVLLDFIDNIRARIE